MFFLWNILFTSTWEHGTTALSKWNLWTLTLTMSNKGIRKRVNDIRPITIVASFLNEFKAVYLSLIYSRYSREWIFKNSYKICNIKLQRTKINVPTWYRVKVSRVPIKYKWSRHPGMCNEIGISRFITYRFLKKKQTFKNWEIMRDYGSNYTRQFRLFFFFPYCT